mmetsp:Transcript_488/g.1233  ORF Transcript_488/g.1233 Transcript_488/m.1233 type:complete len:212 (+) Transcript_488:1004-1639(+)
MAGTRPRKSPVAAMMPPTPPGLRCAAALRVRPTASKMVPPCICCCTMTSSMGVASVAVSAPPMVAAPTDARGVVTILGMYSDALSATRSPSQCATLALMGWPWRRARRRSSARSIALRARGVCAETPSAPRDSEAAVARPVAAEAQPPVCAGARIVVGTSSGVARNLLAMPVIRTCALSCATSLAMDAPRPRYSRRGSAVKGSPCAAAFFQ